MTDLTRDTAIRQLRQMRPTVTDSGAISQADINNAIRVLKALPPSATGEPPPVTREAVETRVCKHCGAAEGSGHYSHSCVHVWGSPVPPSGPEPADPPVNLELPAPTSFDAMEWAQSFVAHVKRYPGIPVDEGTMLSWFASAIMRGYDEYPRRNQPPSASSWRSMDSAPKDGTSVLLGWSSGMSMTGHWDVKRSYWVTEFGSYCGANAPTCWTDKPLPSLPSVAPPEKETKP